MKVYLASAYQTRDVLRRYDSELTFVGMTCTARWLREETKIDAGTVGAATALDDKAVRNHVRDDFEDINAADVLVLFTHSVTGEQGGGGRHIETGYALAKGKRVIVIGTPENVFHRGAPLCTVVPTWHEALLQLVQWRTLDDAAMPMAAES